MPKRPFQLVADSFARFVARSSPERRAQIMRGPQGRIIRRQVFRGMQRELDAEKAKNVDTVLHFEIAQNGSSDRWQVVIADGRCRASRKTDREPKITIKTDNVRFLELVTGLAAGPELFMSGKLQIQGDLMLAAQLPGYFRIPRAGDG